MADRQTSRVRACRRESGQTGGPPRVRPAGSASVRTTPSKRGEPELSPAIGGARSRISHLFLAAVLARQIFLTVRARGCKQHVEKLSMRGQEQHGAVVPEDALQLVHLLKKGVELRILAMSLIADEHG